MTKKKIRAFIIVFTATIVGFGLLVFWMNTYSHAHAGGVKTMFDPTEGDDMSPFFTEDDVVDGVVTQKGKHGCEPPADKYVVTIKGSISKGWIEIQEVDEDGCLLWKERFEPGVEYDKEIIVYDAGCDRDIITVFSADTASDKRGIKITMTAYAKRYRAFEWLFD